MESKKLPKIPGYDLTGCRIFNATEEILDVNNLSMAVRECLDKKDIEGLTEVLDIYLKTARRYLSEK